MDVRRGSVAGPGGASGSGVGAHATHGVAALWGLAEATLFFIVPDVWLTAVGVRDLRRGLLACGWALAGALLGGLLMYGWGSARPEAVAAALDRVPAISPAMLDRVAAQLDAHGAAAALLGPLRGTPYKTYAGLAPGAGVGLLPFLLVSVPARLVRFALLTAGVHWVGPRLLPGASDRARIGVLLAVWALFYAGYFLFLAPG